MASEARKGASNRKNMMTDISVLTIECPRCSKEIERSISRHGAYFPCSCGFKVDAHQINRQPESEGDTDEKMRCPLCNGFVRERKVTGYMTSPGALDLYPGDKLRVCDNYRHSECQFQQHLPQNELEASLSCAGLAVHRQAQL
jgi:phage FluMu protein Com